MKRPLLRSLVVVSFVIGVFAASADDNDLFDDRYYVAPMGSLTGDRGNSSSGDGLGGALAIGKSLIPHLGVEIVGDYLHYRGKTITTPTTGLLCGILSSCPDQVGQLPNQSVYGGGIGVNFYFSPRNAGVFVHANAEGGDRFVYNAGFGFDQPFFDRAIYLRGELLYHKETNYGAQPLFHLGVRVPFGAVHAPAQAEPTPVAVVPVEQPPAPPPETAPQPEPAPATCQPPTPGQPISLEGCKVGDTIVLHGVNFEFNKATLTVNAKALLDQVTDALLARKDIKVEIDGHTDGKGSVPYNQKLSEARAASVMKYLAGRGIDPARMSSRGFGKSMPIADNSTDEGRELNRRVELKVTDSGSSTAQPSEAPASPEASPAPTGEGASAPSDSAQPPSGETPVVAAPATAEAAPVAEPAPTPARKHAARHHKKSAPADAAPSAETPAHADQAPVSLEPAPTQADQAPASPEPAPAQAPQDAGPASNPAPSESAVPDQSAPPPNSAPSAAPADETAAPTEPAPAPPAPVPTPSP